MAAHEVPNIWAAHGLVYLPFYWEDRPDYKLGLNSYRRTEGGDFATDLVEFIDMSIRHGISVLIFSKNGTGRCAVAAIVYLMVKYKWGFQKSYEYVYSKKPDINLNRGFVSQLFAFDRHLLSFIVKGERAQQILSSQPRGADQNDPGMMLNLIANSILSKAEYRRWKEWDLPSSSSSSKSKDNQLQKEITYDNDEHLLVATYINSQHVISSLPGPYLSAVNTPKDMTLRFHESRFEEGIDLFPQTYPEPREAFPNRGVLKGGPLVYPSPSCCVASNVSPPPSPSPSPSSSSLQKSSSGGSKSNNKKSSHQQAPSPSPSMGGWDEMDSKSSSSQPLAPETGYLMRMNTEGNLLTQTLSESSSPIQTSQPQFQYQQEETRRISERERERERERDDLYAFIGMASDRRTDRSRPPPSSVEERVNKYLGDRQSAPSPSSNSNTFTQTYPAFPQQQQQRERVREKGDRDRDLNPQFQAMSLSNPSSLVSADASDLASYASDLSPTSGGGGGGLYSTALSSSQDPLDAAYNQFQRERSGPVKAIHRNNPNRTSQPSSSTPSNSADFIPSRRGVTPERKSAWTSEGSSGSSSGSSSPRSSPRFASPHVSTLPQQQQQQQQPTNQQVSGTSKIYRTGSPAPRLNSKQSSKTPSNNPNPSSTSTPRPSPSGSGPQRGISPSPRDSERISSSSDPRFSTDRPRGTSPGPAPKANNLSSFLQQSGEFVPPYYSSSSQGSSGLGPGVGVGPGPSGPGSSKRNSSTSSNLSVTSVGSQGSASSLSRPNNNNSNNPMTLSNNNSSNNNNNPNLGSSSGSGPVRRASPAPQSYSRNFMSTEEASFEAYQQAQGKSGAGGGMGMGMGMGGGGRGTVGSGGGGGGTTQKRFASPSTGGMNRGGNGTTTGMMGGNGGGNGRSSSSGRGNPPNTNPTTSGTWRV